MIPKRILVVSMLLAMTAACSSSKVNDSTVEERVRGWMELAQASLSDNDPISALKQLEQAEQIDPKLSEIQFLRTRAFHMRQDYPRAIASIRKFIEMEPKSSDGQLTLGIILMESGKPQEALAPLMTAANDPVYERSSQAQTNLGILYYRQGDFKQAEHWISKAITDSPATACVAYYYEGHLRLKESRFKEAKAAYENSTRKFCGAFAEGFLALGITYQQLHEFDHARTTYLEVQKRFPNTKIADQAMERLRKLP